MGVKIYQFKDHVCNSFQAKIVDDQLCYEVDLDKFSDNHNMDRELKIGFNFIMDYNKYRQVSVTKDRKNFDDAGWSSRVVEIDQKQQAFIYLNSIGEIFSIYSINNIYRVFRNVL